MGFPVLEVPAEEPERLRSCQHYSPRPIGAGKAIGRWPGRQAWFGAGRRAEAVEDGPWTPAIGWVVRAGWLVDRAHLAHPAQVAEPEHRGRAAHAEHRGHAAHSRHRGDAARRWVLFCGAVAAGCAIVALVVPLAESILAAVAGRGLLAWPRLAQVLVPLGAAVLAYGGWWAALVRGIGPAARRYAGGFGACQR